MKLTTVFLAAVSLLAAGPTDASSQAQEWSVVRTVGDTLRHCQLLAIADNTLLLESDGQSFNVHLDLLTSLIHHREGRFLKGAGYGATAGAAVGAIAGWISYPSSTPEQNWGPITVDGGPGTSALGGGLIGAIGGGVVGGIIGVSVGGDKTYDLSEKTREQKIQLLPTLIAKRR